MMSGLEVPESGGTCVAVDEISSALVRTSDGSSDCARSGQEATVSPGVVSRRVVEEVCCQTLNCLSSRIVQEATPPPMIELSEDVSEIELSDLEIDLAAGETPQVLDGSDSEGGLERWPEERDPLPAMPQVRSRGGCALDVDAIGTCEAAQLAAAEAVSKGDRQRALEAYTGAILTGDAPALFFVRRAELLLSFRRPCAAINDCSQALLVNPDLGKAYRVRGLARCRLGLWQAALRDYKRGQTLDYDEAAAAEHKFCADKVERLRRRETDEAQRAKVQLHVQAKRREVEARQQASKRRRQRKLETKKNA